MGLLLRDELSRFAAGWRDDLPDGWRQALAHVEPDREAVSADLIHSADHPVFPARRVQPLASARNDAHVLRAFDDLEPQDVRCVLLGQDPFPEIERATGRAFEQGEADEWGSIRCSPSLSGLVSSLAEHRSGDPSFRTKGGFRRAVRSASVRLEQPRALFDRWQDAGVLCLNAGLTLTRYKRGGAREQMEGHIPFWAPVVGATLRHLAARKGKSVVFLLLGRSAQGIADGAAVRHASERAGTWRSSVDEIRLHHPSYRGAGANPFSTANEALERMAERPIAW